MGFMQKRVLVIGAANVDLTMFLDYMPGNGQTVVGNKFRFLPSGKGANTAVAVSRLGTGALLCTRTGKDMNGDRVRRIFAEEKIDMRFLSSDQAKPTGLSVVLNDASGAERAVVFPGANSSVTEADVEAAFTSYPDAAILQFEMPENVILAAARFAADQGIPLILDPVPARRSFPFERMDPVEIFSPNANETYLYTGIMPTGTEKTLLACRELTKIVKASYYVIKLGDRGAFVFDGKYYNVVPGYDVKVVDHTCAGDAFTAALTCEYLETGNINEAAAFANLAGALAVSKVGTIPSLPTRDEVLAFADKLGVSL